MVWYGILEFNVPLDTEKNLLFPETRPTLAFTPDPKNFMDLFVLKMLKKTFILKVRRHYL